MTGEPAARCFRCGEPAGNVFGNSYICDECIPDGDPVTSPEENGGEESPNPVSNETDTQDGAGASGAESDESDATDTHKKINPDSYTSATAFNFEDLSYIELRGDGSKLPKRAWGGYSQDFEDAPHVYRHKDVLEHPGREWGIVDVEDLEHGSTSLLIFDLDVHKAPEDFDPDDLTLPEGVPIVRTQSGGYHLPFMVHEPRGAGAESDFSLSQDVDWDVDIRGSFVSHHVVAPADIPGVGGDYELLNDTSIPGVFDPADATGKIRYRGESLIEYAPDRGVGTDVEIDRDVEPPAEMPTCYHRGLQLRAASPDDHPNTHKVNVLTAMCGLAAGYEIDAMVDHFCEDYAPDGADREKTRYQLGHIADKIDRGEYGPPAIATLQDYGILDEGESCDCSIEYHGGQGGADAAGQKTEPTPAIGLKRLEALDAQQRERYLRAVPDGALVPTMDDVADEIHDAVEGTLRDEGYAVIRAPTGSNKTGVAAETPWLDIDDEVTGGRPVVLFCETTDARDEVVERAEAAGLDDVKVLKGYRELCEVARGDYDPANIDDEDPDAPEPITIDGQPASEWVRERVEKRGVPISVVHTDLGERLRRQGRECPCCAGERVCLTKAQWPPNGFVDEERIRCAVTEHTVDECDDCHLERVRCDDVGTHGHDVDSCPRCHEERVRCDLHDPDHLVGECDECHTERAPQYDLVVATDPFAFVPSLRTKTNVIHDEQPTYTEDFGLDDPRPEAITSRVRQAVTAFLALSDDGPDTFEELVELARACARCDAAPWNEQAAPGDRPNQDLGRRWIETFTALEYTPARQWYLDDPRAHTLAPALAEAIWRAITGDVGPETDPDERGAGVFDANGRASATVSHAPPRLDDDARDDDGWNRTHVTVTIDDENAVRTVRNAPDFSTARSVVGLDARPTPWIWQRNVHPDMTLERVLDTDEARRWRRFERGQTVVQVGDATRPAGSEGRYFNERHARALVGRLREHFGDDFRAAGSAKATEDDLAAVMRDAGVPLDELETLHYGQEKSRNVDAFATASAGLVYDSIDPGDDYVLDLLAECGLEAEPERSDAPCEGCGNIPDECDGHGDDELGCPDCWGDGCHECDGTGRERAHGRGFVGPDADHAAKLLESVRATHVAQMIGRFGRDLDVASGERNLTFVATDAVPPDLVDYEVPGVQWIATDLQRQIIEALRDRPQATARELADVVGCSKKHVWDTLSSLEARDVTERHRGAGQQGADLWRPGRDVGADDVQLRLDEVVTSPVQSSCTWSVTVRDVAASDGPSTGASAGDGQPDVTAIGGDRPSDDVD